MPFKQPAKDPSAEICVFAPWPLYTITIEHIEEGADEVYFHAGGQAVWVARMINGLGRQSVLVGPLGGESRPVIQAMLAAENLRLRSVPIRGTSGGYVNDRRGGTRKEIANVPPPRLDRHEVDDLYNAVFAESLRCGTVVITGIPDGKVLPVSTFDRLVKDLRANDVRVVADVAGSVLEAISGGLTILKVSHEDLIEAGLAADDSRGSIVAAMETLREKADNVVVSCAGAGCLALMDGQLLEAKGPELEALDPTGAGDSMTAALAVALSAGMSAADTLCLATAAGALNVTRHGRGTGRLEDIAVLGERVSIERIAA